MYMIETDLALSISWAYCERTHHETPEIGTRMVSPRGSDFNKLRDELVEHVVVPFARLQKAGWIHGHHVE